jgi:DNA modification methylase
VPRESRNKASKRLALPFDVHSIFIKHDFEFIDDIIWEKPIGAGWVSGRGRFSADRNPMQYKTVPVIEYVLVYRKKSDKLIDWFIRNHPDKEIIKKSKIDEYDKTNIWKISPARNKNHPAVFPVKLAEKVIKYYSFVNDVVLDPFAGIGTTGTAALNLDRKFVLIEKESKYINLFSEKEKDRIALS